MLVLATTCILFAKTCIIIILTLDMLVPNSTDWHEKMATKHFVPQNNP